MNSDYLTIDQLSQYLNVKKSTLYFQVESGELPHYRIGRLIRFRKDEVDAWMKNHRGENRRTGLRANRILNTVNRSEASINNLVKNAIDGVKRKRYTPIPGKPGQKVKGLETKEV